MKIYNVQSVEFDTLEEIAALVDMASITASHLAEKGINEY